MNYEINVAKDGYHYFATADRSLTSQDEAIKAFEHFKKLFPAEDGYHLQLSEIRHTSKQIKVREDK